MAKTLSINQFSYNFSYTFTKDNALGGLTTDSGTYAKQFNLTSGTGAGQADLMVLLAGSLAASDTLTIDLVGALADVFGDTVSMARFKTLVVELTGGSGTSAKLAPNGSAGVTTLLGGTSPTLTIRNPGFVAIGCSDATGYGLTATTADKFDLTNLDGTNSLTYRVLVGGCSA
jgi:hypothetical protein